MAGRALVTGATGFVGRRLASALVQAGWDVRGMVRDRAGSRARQLEEGGLELHEGDVLRPASLRGAGHGVDVAYYLIHSMGRGATGDFVASERAAATAFAEMARTDGIARVVYLGGLGDSRRSKHLRSRHETALALARHGPPLTYFRAGMVVGAQSESDAGVARPLVEGLAGPTVVTDASGTELFDVQPIGFDEALRRAVADDPELRPHRRGRI